MNGVELKTAEIKALIIHYADDISTEADNIQYAIHREGELIKIVQRIQKIGDRILELKLALDNALGSKT